MKGMNVNGIPFIAGRWPLDPAMQTIIFIHGAAGTKGFWREQVEGLVRCCNTIALDLPGHGDSGESGFITVDAYAESVEKFIFSLCISSPVVCGLSMGGAIVQKLLLDGRIKYRAGIIVNSGARLKVMHAIFELIKSNYEGFVSSLPVMGAAAGTDPSVFADIIADAGKCLPDTAAGDFTACNTFDAAESLGEIKTPVLVLTAEEDKLSPVKYGKFMHEKIPGSSYVNIPGAGHFSPVEKPEEINSVIESFINGL